VAEAHLCQLTKVLDDPELRSFFRTLMEEAFAVGKAKGVALHPAFLDDRVSFVVNEIERGRKASMAHDLERGKRLELDWLSGKVRALGRTLGNARPSGKNPALAYKHPGPRLLGSLRP
jgi:2-dehydropantoate 2-reductase